MNICTVRDNLKNTIAGKEQMLINLDQTKPESNVVAQFLEINIDELKRILVDVEQCCIN